MSTKTSLFLTKDNEHCYTDAIQPNFIDGKYIGDTITLEFDRKNVKIETITDDYLIIEIKAGSEWYDLINKLKQ